MSLYDLKAAPMPSQEDYRIVALREIERWHSRHDKMEAALKQIANCGQSIEPDHWKFREMARDVASRALMKE